ncbi:hypothetical protein [Candidatus Spongiihabitans sp.]|uniref:hypothetical protein n=1 Tax=Candidatus Spongiihabitans sp. TaxID=3101308 RepID=UPI003C7B25D8
MSAASPLGFSLDYRVKPDNDGITRVRHSCPGRHSNESWNPVNYASRVAGHDH